VRPRSHLKQDPMYRSLPEDEVHNEALVRAAVESTDRAAFLSRDTVFSKTLAAEAVAAAPVLRVVHSLSIAAVRCWMKITSGIYPTASYLHRIGRAPTSDCPHCSGGARETLGHFAGECPRFHDARTSAHNQSWSAISSVLSSMLPAWELCWETSMSACGLELSPASFRSGDAPHTTCVTAGSLTPDGVAVHRTLRKILILEFCRPAHGSSPSLQASHLHSKLRGRESARNTFRSASTSESTPVRGGPSTCFLSSLAFTDSSMWVASSTHAVPWTSCLPSRLFSRTRWRRPR